jgi:hypothetical protein
MANVNSGNGFQNLPAQVIAVSTETALLVPAVSTYPGLPSPTLPAAAGLFISPNPDIVGSIVDGHPFKVRVAGKVFTGGSYTFLCNLYTVPASIVAAGTQATLSGDTVVVTNAASSAFTGASNFIVEAEFLWDSTSKFLTGIVTTSQVNGVNIAPNSGTAGTMVATTKSTLVYTSPNIINVLNFMPSFTFGTAAATNAVTVTEFLIDRV